MSCTGFNNPMLFDLDPQPKLSRGPDFNMSNVIYNTQGEIVNETQMDKYVKTFANQCKYDNSLQTYGKFVCKSTCDNKLNDRWLSEKIIAVKYYNQDD